MPLTIKFSRRIIWNKVFKNGPSKICGRQPLKNLKGYGLLKETPSNFLNAVSHRFYLVHPWMLCPIYGVPCRDWTLSVSCLWYCLLSESAKRKKNVCNWTYRSGGVWLFIPRPSWKVFRWRTSRSYFLQWLKKCNEDNLEKHQGKGWP